MLRGRRRLPQTSKPQPDKNPNTTTTTGKNANHLLQTPEKIDMESREFLRGGDRCFKFGFSASPP
jgi:hypothetical protein